MAMRRTEGWSFSTLFLVKDSLAAMLEAAGCLEDALREYSELEACYSEAIADGGALAAHPFGDPFSTSLDISEKPLNVLLHLSCSQVVLVPALTCQGPFAKASACGMDAFP